MTPHSLIILFLEFIGSFLLFFFFALLPIYFLFSATERKLVADLQARVGPHHGGAEGVLQGFYDFVKLITKRTPQRSTGGSASWIWSAISTALIFGFFAVLPMRMEQPYFQSDLSLFLPLIIFILASCAHVLFGQEFDDFSTVFGSHRRATTVLSLSAPILTSVLGLVIFTGETSLVRLGTMQGASPLSWNIFGSYGAIFQFGSLFWAGLILTFQPPFEEIGFDGVGRRGFELVRHDLTLFWARFSWAIYLTILYFGAGQPGEIFGTTGMGNFIWSAVIVIKALLLLLLGKLLGKALVQVRLEQVNHLIWKWLFPLGLVGLVLSVI